MIQKIKSHAVIISSLLTIAMSALVPGAAAACNTNTANQVGLGASQAATGGPGSGTYCSATGVDGSGIGAIASNVVNIFSIVVGAVAVIMIIYGGFRYITSGGDSNGVSSAKNTLIYAIVGLIIVALAQIIVHFVLNQTNNAVNS